jgi:hypothetical protein
LLSDFDVSAFGLVVFGFKSFEINFKLSVFGFNGSTISINIVDLLYELIDSAFNLFKSVLLGIPFSS